MDPVFLDPNLLMQIGLIAGIVTAVVAALNKAFTLSGRASVLAGAISSLLVTVMLMAGTAQGSPIDWGKIPIEALAAWLSSMGLWTGGKTIVTGRAGGEPKP